VKGKASGVRDWVAVVSVALIVEKELRKIGNLGRLSTEIKNKVSNAFDAR
jgi:hypothetical protein